MKPQVVVDAISVLRQMVVREFERRSAEAIAQRKRFIVALPGGSVATAVFPDLVDSHVDWLRTDVFWADERAVPPDHADSNYRLASTLLLVPARVPEANVHRLEGERQDIDAAAEQASREVEAIAGTPPRFDLVLLGVGEDGHIASIFPGREVATRLPTVAAVFDSPKAPPRRLTLTMPVLADARHVIVMASGRSKAAVVRDALDAERAQTPLAELLRRAASALLLLDFEASYDRAQNRR